MILRHALFRTDANATGAARKIAGTTWDERDIEAAQRTGPPTVPSTPPWPPCSGAWLAAAFFATEPDDIR